MVIAALLSIALSGTTPPKSPLCPTEWSPTQADILTVEKSIKLFGKHELSTYERYYAGVCVDGRKTIRGVFEIPYSSSRASPTIHIVKELELPVIMDGGCSIVDFTVDAADLTHGKARCHGYG